MTVSASQFDVPIEALFDRTACLVPDVQEFAVGDGQTWTKPDLALYTKIILIAPGGDGGTGGGGGLGGGGGGSAGGVAIWEGPSSLLESTLTVTVKDHNTTTGTTSISTVLGGKFLLGARSGLKGADSPGLDNGGAGASGPYPYNATNMNGDVFDQTTGGASTGSGLGDAALGGVRGGSAGGAGGDSGMTIPNQGGIGGAGSGGGSGGIGASGTSGGTGGGGYGAGGGGGGGTAGGGGGGGGGYGASAIAATGTNAAGGGAGGAGAPGRCIITTWRGVII